jgi:anti-sigma B factor antagonist
MNIDIKTVQQVTVVTITGELDGRTAPLAQERIAPLCQAGSKIILDMSQVMYMSSAGLRLMLLLYRRVSDVNGRILLVGLSEEIRDTMLATGFLAYFTAYDTLDAGVAVLQQ